MPCDAYVRVPGAFRARSSSEDKSAMPSSGFTTRTLGDTITGEYLGSQLLACIDRVLIKPLKVLGYHSQVLPNNWKLYAENNKDSYHASLLHVFHNTFGVARPNMGGGIKLSANGWHHLSFTEKIAPSDDATGREKVRSLKEQYSLDDPGIMEHRLELGDTITNSIQAVFPSLVIQQILNALAARHIVPRGPDRTEFLWTVLGFEDDDEELLNIRLRANNLVGPAGFISMEDGCVGGFIQRAAKTVLHAETIMPMGGTASRYRDRALPRRLFVGSGGDGANA